MSWIRGLFGLERCETETSPSDPDAAGSADVTDVVGAATRESVSRVGSAQPITGDIVDDSLEMRSAELVAETRTARRRVREYCDSRATLAAAAVAVAARGPVG